MARPNQQQGPADDQPWYLKYGVRFLGIVAGFCKYSQANDITYDLEMIEFRRKQ